MLSSQNNVGPECSESFQSDLGSKACSFSVRPTLAVAPVQNLPLPLIESILKNYYASENTVARPNLTLPNVWYVMMVDKKYGPKSVSQGQNPLLRVRFDSERWVCVDPDAVDGASTTDPH